MATTSAAGTQTFTDGGHMSRQDQKDILITLRRFCHNAQYCSHQEFLTEPKSIWWRIRIGIAWVSDSYSWKFASEVSEDAGRFSDESD